ncbi:MAG: hypothetical protein AB1515_01995 [Nitrospirota bacterium]
MSTPTGQPAGGVIRNDVKVAFLDGSSVTGTVVGFNPQRPTFYLHLHQADDEATSREIAFGGVKMITFLRDPAQPKRSLGFPPTARLVTVRFQDGEVIRGITQSYGGARLGLFLIPTALEEAERIYIPVSAIREVVSVKRLGEILTEEGMVTSDKIEQALREQQKMREEPIGQILVKQQIISDEQLAKGLQLQQQHKGKRIGEILLDQGFIESPQLDEALALQRQRRDKKLGQVMVELGYATHKMIGIALAIQYNVPFLDLSAQSIDAGLRELVPAEIARRWNIVPLNVQQNILTIAVADPNEHGAEDELRARTGLVVIMAVATPQDITRTLAKYYGI